MKNHTKGFYPKVSIIIPVYNGSNYLDEAINSALSQTYKNLEIIVVNDGSSDNGSTEKIAKSYGKRIIYFSKPNGGTSTALNLGIKNMTGEYFSWLSHDDQYYPKKIERQIEVLSKLKNKDTIMMTDLDGIDEDYRKIYQTDYRKHLEEYPPRKKSYIHPVIYNQTHGCTLLIPKKCFDTVGLFDEKEKVAQDFEFFYRAFKKFPHKLIPEVLVTARDSSNRQGRRSKSKGNEEYSRLFIKIIKELSESDYKLLAETKLDFYSDMLDFFCGAGYTYAWDYVSSLVTKNLQISSYDLVGNKFNGYDLHKDLRKHGILSKQMVLYKESDDPSTIPFNFEDKNATKNLLLNREFFLTDIVHLHLVHNLLDFNYLPLMTRLKPTIITLHDTFYLGGHCIHHFDCKKWQTHCKDCPYLEEHFPLPADYSAFNFELKKEAIKNSQVTAIVASKWMLEKLKKSPIWKGKKVYLLPFGINQKLFKIADKKKVRKELGIPTNNTVLMFRANSDSFKGLYLIKKALRKIVSKKKISLLVVDGIGLLEKFKNKYDIREYGWVKDDELLAKLYQACDIFLMPSKQESFGMMAAEAMSCGKVVLSVNCDGSALGDTINSPECGLSVDEEEYADNLQYLLDNPNEVLRRGKKSYNFAKKVYGKEKYIRGMIAIYEEVMKNHHIDKDAELVLSQMKTYLREDICVSPPAHHVSRRLNKYWKENSLTRKIYRFLLPLEIRKSLSKKFGEIFKSIKPMLPMRLKNRLLQR